MTAIGEHIHQFKKVKYTRMVVDNPDYTGKGKTILKTLVCDCGKEIGKDLLDKMPERKK